ncbi:hypothetical protein MRX96_022390 [Rhipicephalus microplus]
MLQNGVIQGDRRRQNESVEKTEWYTKGVRMNGRSDVFLGMLASSGAAYDLAFGVETTFNLFSDCRMLSALDSDVAIGRDLTEVKLVTESLSFVHSMHGTQTL